MSFFGWLDKNKDKDILRIQFLKLIYSIEISTTPHVVISVVLEILIPVLWTDRFILAICILLFLVLENICYCICEKYHVKKFEERKFATSILEDNSALLKSIEILINDTPSWKTEIFSKTCQMICEKIHEEFKEVYKCNVRVSVEYTFEKDQNCVNEIFRKMAGRSSDNRNQPKKATKLSSRKKYYSYKIFTENMRGINYLEINNPPKNWYNNPSHNVKVEQYLGLAHSFNDKDVSFILQIDCLDKFNFGKDNTDEEIKRFVNSYLTPHVNIISIAYLLCKNKKGKVGEV